MDSLRLRLGAAHFAALTRIADAVSMYQRRLPHAQLRPSARPGAEPGAARQWWRYAAQVALKRRLGTRISWEAMQKAVVCRWGRGCGCGGSARGRGTGRGLLVHTLA